jgi:hypothetical protein
VHSSEELKLITRSQVFSKSGYLMPCMRQNKEFHEELAPPWVMENNDRAKTTME